MSLNLAQRPFVNSRPVRRLVLVLWCLSAVLAAANLFFYTRHFSGQEERQDRLGALAGLEKEERERLAALESELASADLEWQNRQVEFLNLRIAERVFPWSRLFDSLTEVLPRPVRLTLLRPRVGRGAGRGRDRAGLWETVELDLRGEARGDAAILDFIGKLFEHPAFRDPNLSSEARRPRAEVIDFTLSVNYLPALATPAEETPPAEQAAPAASDGAAAAEEVAG